MAKQLKWANDQGARFTALLGPRELTDQVITLRDMVSGDQEQVPLAQAGARLRARAGAGPAG
jgi:histidyl-tRNA synthetase